MSYQELRGGNVDSEGRMRCFAKTERCTLCILQHPPKVKTVDGKKARGCQGGSLRMVSWSQEDLQGRRKKKYSGLESMTCLFHRSQTQSLQG